jgi:hypothetical protein
MIASNRSWGYGCHFSGSNGLRETEHFGCSSVIAKYFGLCQALRMGNKLGWLAILLCMAGSECAASPKVHVITFGKWTSAQWPDGSGKKLLPLRVRALLVDTRVKEYTTGISHDVTERLFVVRRVFRVNDALPEESAARWQWQRGGWLLVDRATGKVSAVSLPEFDAFYSTTSWYRDYAAYCGVSEDGKKLYAMVAQVGRRKPVLKKVLGEPDGDDAPDSECPAPKWERSPARVTFEPDETQKVLFTIRGRVVDVVNEPEENAEE